MGEGGYLYLDARNWEKILRDRNRFFLYNPFFVDGIRVNLVQVWDYHPDGTVVFHPLYTFERENQIYRKEEFERVEWYCMMAGKAAWPV